MKTFKILLLTFLAILLFSTISLATFTPDAVRAPSSSNEINTISIIESVLDEYNNNVDNDSFDYNYSDNTIEDENEDSTEKNLEDSLNPNSFKPVDGQPVFEVSSISNRISGLIKIIGTIISIFILLPICLVCGILYMVKSKSSKAKKITIGIIIISIPIIVFVILSILPLFFA